MSKALQNIAKLRGWADVAGFGADASSDAAITRCIPVKDVLGNGIKLAVIA